ALPGSIASSRHDFEDLTLLDSTLLRGDEIDRLRPAVHDAQADAAAAEGAATKVHDAYTRLDDGTPLMGRRARAALYMVRDPRDVAVSFAFHQSISLDQSVAFLNRGAARLAPVQPQLHQNLLNWNGHVASWLDQADLPVHLIRYEDLRADTLEVFRRALDFLGISHTPQQARRAVSHSDFAELQRQEREHGFRERQKGQALFFRRGEVGDWRNHLNDEQVRLIETAHAAMMDRLGYDRVTKAEEQ
ncbi:MAG TPA: sulfotransferase domain-containing protein, partial [Magnetospirillum sp.]|nr:sulfotransferase domain-containing protein [Magnetospirillum sp.]